MRYKLHEDEGEIQIRRALGSLGIGIVYTRPSANPSMDPDRVLSIHLRRKARKDGPSMCMGRKWFIGCPEGTLLSVCLIPNRKFMVYREDKKIWGFHLQANGILSMSTNSFQCVRK